MIAMEATLEAAWHPIHRLRETAANPAGADALGAGDLSPEEGAAVAGILETQRRAVETVELERRLTALEQAGGRELCIAG
jgi:hypothetical protein